MTWLFEQILGAGDKILQAGVIAGAIFAVLLYLIAHSPRSRALGAVIALAFLAILVVFWVLPMETLQNADGDFAKGWRWWLTEVKKDPRFGPATKGLVLGLIGIAMLGLLWNSKAMKEGGKTIIGITVLLGVVYWLIPAMRPVLENNWLVVAASVAVAGVAEGVKSAAGGKLLRPLLHAAAVAIIVFPIMEDWGPKAIKNALDFKRELDRKEEIARAEENRREAARPQRVVAEEGPRTTSSCPGTAETYAVPHRWTPIPLAGCDVFWEVGFVEGREDAETCVHVSAQGVVGTVCRRLAAHAGWELPPTSSIAVKSAMLDKATRLPIGATFCVFRYPPKTQLTAEMRGKHLRLCRQMVRF